MTFNERDTNTKHTVSHTHMHSVGVGGTESMSFLSLVCHWLLLPFIARFLAGCMTGWLYALIIIIIIIINNWRVQSFPLAIHPTYTSLIVANLCANYILLFFVNYSSMHFVDNMQFVASNNKSFEMKINAMTKPCVRFDRMMLFVCWMWKCLIFSYEFSSRCKDRSFRRIN